MKDYICPPCNGRGYTVGIACPGARQIQVKCALCDGSGSVDSLTKYRFFRGRTMRAERVAKYETQAQAAKRLGVDVVTYSKMEQGLAPVPGEDAPWH